MSVCPKCKEEVAIPEHTQATHAGMSNMFNCHSCQSVLKLEEGQIVLVFSQPTLYPKDDGQEDEHSAVSDPPQAGEISHSAVHPDEEIPHPPPPSSADEEEDDQKPGTSASFDQEDPAEGVQPDDEPEQMEEEAPPDDIPEQMEEEPLESEPQQPSAVLPDDEDGAYKEEESLQNDPVAEQQDELLYGMEDDEKSQVVSIPPTPKTSKEFSDVARFGNQNSLEQKGFLRYNLKIEGITVKEQEHQILAVLDDPRMGWSPRDILKNLKDETLIIANLNPVKAMRLVQELRRIPFLQLSWKQHMAAEDTQYQEEAPADSAEHPSSDLEENPDA